ncbi:hypothetical protein DBU19_003361 [Escherichia coli O7]|nr:hypothetical protein [Escherichia coli O7]
MALFYYQALERNGRKTKGMIEADSARHARQLLRGKELIPVHIEARMNTSSGGMLQRRRHAHRRVAAADLALFTRQLATLVQAAMPLETCLQAVSEQSEKLHVKSLGMALRSRIQEGYTLSDSLREHPRVFDSLFCSMVAAGEKSGHLDVVLNRLADYTEQRQRLKSRLLQAMLYPLVLLVVATGVVTILLTAVVPKIIEQFDHLGHALADISEMRVVQGMDDGLYQKLKPLVCALPMTRQQININTLDVTQSVLLEALFDPWLSPVQARALLQQRPAKGWEDVDQFLAQPLLADVDERTKKQLKTVLSVDSNYFWLRSDITVNEIELTMNSLIVRMGPQHFSVLWHQTGESE